MLKNKKRLNKLGHAILHNYQKGENVNISDLDDETFNSICKFVDEATSFTLENLHKVDDKR